MPPGALVIGTNGGGDLLLLPPTCAEACGETVYWWDHELKTVEAARRSLRSG